MGSAKKTFKKGEILIREGESGSSAYVLETGSVEILVQRGGMLVQIGTRGPGSILGEMAMIDDKPRTATVRALEDCSIMEVTRDDFAHRVDHADPILRMVMRVVMTRYRDVIGRSQFIEDPVFSTSSAEASENSGELHQLAVNAIKIHHELKAAIEKNELLLYYQPIIDLQTMKVSGFEALMRWKHPEKGMISPGVFIPVAEESGLIVELSRWALSVACEAAKALRQAADPGRTGAHPLSVSVNFSVKDFSSGHFFDHIMAILDDKAVDPSHIHLEITEGLLMEQPAAAMEALEKCRQKGLRISIDDFGTGYSSLSYLHQFPIDTLKIDQSFVRSMHKKPSSLMLVKSIAVLAHNLHMKVIAEGIETAQEGATLREIGCEEAQGFWFARPMPLEEALKFVRTWTPPAMEDKK